MQDLTRLNNFIQEMKTKGLKDLHITRAFGMFVAISNGKVIKVTGKPLDYCPLASTLYGNSKAHEMAKKATEEKIKKFGYFTSKREILRKDIAVPYGMSEMLMYALKNNTIDCAITVCDGAGTVVTDNPEIVQGIGARMNGLFYTTPIPQIMNTFSKKGALPLGEIAQYKGLQKALEREYKKIAITINGFTTSDKEVKQIITLAKKAKAKVFIATVCTTGISRKQAETLLKYTDIACSCASKEIRDSGEKARLQITTPIPIFVYTHKGIELIASYVKEKKLITKLPSSHQFLISGCCKGKLIHIGNRCSYLTKMRLPVGDKREPHPLR